MTSKIYYIVSISYRATLAEVEAMHIRRVLAANDGMITRAASRLGISPRTLRRRLRECGLDVLLVMAQRRRWA